MRKYGYNTGDIVESRVELVDENHNPVLAGTLLRLVAIAPKVRYTPPLLIAENRAHFDSKLYLANLVRAEQKDDFGNHFRVHFVTFRKTGLLTIEVTTTDNKKHVIETPLTM